MRQTILSALAAILVTSSPAFPQATTKENVDKLRDRDTVELMREECRAESERACQVLFLLRYISQTETEISGFKRELQYREDEIWKLECRLSEQKLEVLTGYFERSVQEGNAPQAEELMRAIIREEKAHSERCFR